MRGTGPVGWNAETVYAYFTTEGSTMRVRVSVDEADRLGLTEGQRVRLALPGAAAQDVLVTRVSRVPPFAWAEVTALAAAVSRAG